MAEHALKGRKVAILVTDGFEKVELTEPRKALDEAGAETRIISPKANRVRSWNFTDWDQELPVDVQLAQAKPKDFESPLLPGGVINPDALRIQPEAIAFVRSFFDASKPVAAICHGPWIVIEAGSARPAHDLLAIAKDRLKECRSGLGRSRGRCRSGPGDKPQPATIFPAFNREMRKLFSSARGRQQAA